MTYVEHPVFSPLACCTWERRTTSAREHRVVPDACVDLIWSGERLIIAGGISAAEFQRLKTREAVFEYVGALFARLRPFAHRFVFSASCNTPYTAPWQTIVWFRDAWKQFAGL